MIKSISHITKKNYTTTKQLYLREIITYNKLYFKAHTKFALGNRKNYKFAYLKIIGFCGFIKKSITT